MGKYIDYMILRVKKEEKRQDEAIREMERIAEFKAREKARRKHEENCCERVN